MPPAVRQNSSESSVPPISRSSTAGPCSISCCSALAATGTCCPCSRAPPAFESTDWALAIPAPTHIEPHVERVTLNPAILAVARQILVVMHGAGKAAILADIFGPELDPTSWPAQLTRRDGATWILDQAAAASLPAR